MPEAYVNEFMNAPASDNNDNLFEWTPIDKSGKVTLSIAVPGLWAIIPARAKLVYVTLTVAWPANADSEPAAVGGFPFPDPFSGRAQGLAVIYTDVGDFISCYLDGDMLNFYKSDGDAYTNADLAGKSVELAGILAVGRYTIDE